MEHIQNFEDFINEDINFERVSETECYLTRPWYYYNLDDDIIYGSDEKPSGDYNIVFENEESGTRLFELDLDTNKMTEYTGNDDVVAKINELANKEIDLNDLDMIQQVFENNNDSRYILLDGKRMLASSFDVIEEN